MQTDVCSHPGLITHEMHVACSADPSLSPFSRHCRRAASLIRGLEPLYKNSPSTLDEENRPTPSSEEGQEMEGAGDRGSGKRRAERSALCLASPDGLPLLGFHPGFEPGRVVVACSVSGASCPSSTSHTHYTSAASPKSDAAPHNGSIPSPSSPLPGGLSPPVSPLLTSLGDGFQLVPLLAKAAADLLETGSSSGSLIASSSALGASTSPNTMVDDGRAEGGPSGELRGGIHLGGSGVAVSSSSSAAVPESWKGRLSASAVMATWGVDSWGDLGRLQDGSVQQYRSPEDLEREADEREDLGRAKAA